MNGKQYIGDNEVSQTETVTVLGNEYLKVTYTNGKNELMPDKLFKELVTSESKDASDLRARKIYPIVKDILQLFVYYNIKPSEINALIQLVSMSVDNNVTEAIDYRLGGTERDMSILDYEIILDEKNKKLTVSDVIKN